MANSGSAQCLNVLIIIIIIIIIIDIFKVV